MSYTIEKFEDSYKSELKRLIKDFKKFESVYEPAFKTDNKSVDDLYNSEMVGEDKQVYLALLDNELVGFISFEKSSKNDPLIAEHIPALYISGLFIDEKHRGQGLAQKLMERSEQFAKEKNIKFIKLLMFTKNQLARDFYFKYGFEDYESSMIKELI